MEKHEIIQKGWTDQQKSQAKLTIQTKGLFGW